jgi:MarR family transcriptional regulator, organic hydroperoxide resistance regulator
MEEAGLVVRRPDPADARLVRLYLTARGRAAREPVREARAALERRATATLTAAEREDLHVALTKIIAELRDGPDAVSEGRTGR